jgi:hypothetical protein
MVSKFWENVDQLSPRFNSLTYPDQSLRPFIGGKQNISCLSNSYLLSFGRQSSRSHALSLFFKVSTWMMLKSPPLRTGYREHYNLLAGSLWSGIDSTLSFMGVMWAFTCTGESSTTILWSNFYVFRTKGWCCTRSQRMRDPPLSMCWNILRFPHLYDHERRIFECVQFTTCCCYGRRTIFWISESSNLIQCATVKTKDWGI